MVLFNLLKFTVLWCCLTGLVVLCWSIEKRMAALANGAYRSLRHRSCASTRPYLQMKSWRPWTMVNSGPALSVLLLGALGLQQTVMKLSCASTS